MKREAQNQDTVVLAIVSEKRTNSRVPTEYAEKLKVPVHATDPSSPSSGLWDDRIGFCYLWAIYLNYCRPHRIETWTGRM